MKNRVLISLVFVVVLIASIYAVPEPVQAQSGWVFWGCWSPYPSCSFAYDIYRDPQGRYWRCGNCGTTTNPSPSTCKQVSSSIEQIGYWCS